MAKIYIYDGDGFHVATKLAADGATFHNSTTVEPGADLENPFWTGETWTDGIPVVEVAPAQLSKVAFMDLAYGHLGADLAGVARYGAIMLQAKASTSPLVVAAMERYAHASVFERGDVATFLDILLSDPSVDVTPGERTAIINGWPDNGAA